MPVLSRPARLLVAVVAPAAAILGAVGIASALSPSPSLEPARITVGTTPTTGVSSVTPTTPGTSPTTPGTSPTTPGTVGTGGDFSGPCDEAEHANDPRCTGAAPVDNRGPGSASGDDNSGPGNGDGDDSSNSGPGNGDGDDDSNSGPGGGGSTGD